MRLRLGIVAFILITACSDSVGPGVLPPPPPPPSPSLEFTSGTWHSPFVPSGAVTVLQLQVTADSITGTDHEYGFMSVEGDSGTVSGEFREGVATLTVHYSGGGTATYVGHMTAQDVLDGTWTPPSPRGSWSLRLIRQSS